MADRLTEAFDEIYTTYNQVPHAPGSDLLRHPEHTRRVLERLGRPERAFPVLMVTGSKGKGSHAYYVAEILRAHGLRVGFSSSPGLLSHLDRIRLDGRVVAPEAFLEAWARVRPAMRAVARELPSGQYIGPVGLFAATAVQLFRDASVDFAVIECGRGARFDDVAEIEHAYALLTNVLPEHLRELGPTVAEVAWHKLGIVRRETRELFVGDRSPLIARTIAAVRNEWPPAVQVIDLKAESTIASRETTASGTRLTVSVGPDPASRSLFVPAIGPTVDNVAGALAIACRLLGRLDWNRVEDLAPRLAWPGRGEILSTDPYILLDASIHRDSAQALIAAAGGRFDLAVLSLPNSKDRDGVRAVVEPVADRIWFTTCSNPHLFYDYTGFPIRPVDRIVPDAGAALRQMLASTRSGQRVLLLGTISFIADCYRFFGRSRVDTAPPPVFQP